MKSFKCVFLVFCLLSTGLWAQESVKQTRVNLTIKVKSFEQAGDGLRKIMSGFPATVDNLSLQPGNGNANLKVEPGHLNKLLGELSKLGVVETQSQNINDLTSSLSQYEQRLKTFKDLEKIDLRSQFTPLAPVARTLAQSEYQSWLKGQIESTESSLRSYREQAKYAEIQLYLTSPEPVKATASPEPACDPGAVGCGQAAPPPAPPQPKSPSPEFFLLCLINMLGLWVIYRKVDGPPTGTPL